MRSGRPQRTLRAAVTFSGIGLHSGVHGSLVCRPAPVDAGITFVRADLPDTPPVAARVESVTDVTRGVTLGHRGGVRTVEHLLAAAWGLGITNLRVEVHGPELPALDGSAAPYCRMFEETGVDKQSHTLDPIPLHAPVWVSDAASWVFAMPAAHFRVTYIIAIPSPALGIQIADVEVDRRRFVEEIAPARTWGLVGELQALHAAGLALGAGDENALGIGSEGYTGTPRFPDEPARHKVLDLIGDLALLGRPLEAHVIAFGAGHALHIELARRLEGVLAKEQGSTRA